MIRGARTLKKTASIREEAKGVPKIRAMRAPRGMG
jgi:hypothetical protein